MLLCLISCHFIIIIIILSAAKNKKMNRLVEGLAPGLPDQLKSALNTVIKECDYF